MPRPVEPLLGFDHWLTVLHVFTVLAMLCEDSRREPAVWHETCCHRDDSAVDLRSTARNCSAGPDSRSRPPYLVNLASTASARTTVSPEPRWHLSTCRPSRRDGVHSGDRVRVAPRRGRQPRRRPCGVTCVWKAFERLPKVGALDPIAICSSLRSLCGRIHRCLAAAPELRSRGASNKTTRRPLSILVFMFPARNV